jgi:hypothetical protein
MPNSIPRRSLKCPGHGTGLSDLLTKQIKELVRSLT